jgi:hypothetical protein
MPPCFRTNHDKNYWQRGESPSSSSAAVDRSASSDKHLTPSIQIPYRYPLADPDVRRSLALLPSPVSLSQSLLGEVSLLDTSAPIPRRNMKRGHPVVGSESVASGTVDAEEGEE